MKWGGVKAEKANCVPTEEPWAGSWHHKQLLREVKRLDGLGLVPQVIFPETSCRTRVCLTFRSAFLQQHQDVTQHRFDHGCSCEIKSGKWGVNLSKHFLAVKAVIL